MRSVLILLLLLIVAPASAREVMVCGKKVDADATSLTCWNAAPTAGELRRLPDLKELDVSYVKGVTHLRFLAGAPQLERLDISRLPLTSLQPLAGLSSLQRLEMESMGTTGLDLAPLGKLTQMRCLHLEGTEAKGWMALKTLTALRVLEAEFAKLKTLAFVSGMTELVLLDASYGEVRDLTPLKGLSKLRFLELHGQPNIVDVSPLGGLVALEELGMQGVKATDVGVLGRLKHLREADLNFAAVKSMQGIEGAKALEHLSLSHTSLAKLPVGMKKLAALKVLELASTPLKNIAPLSGLGALVHLDLGSTSVSDASVLGGLHALEDIDLSYTQVAKLPSLAKLKNLKALDLSYTQVSDLTAVFGLTRLEFIAVTDTGVVSFAPLVKAKLQKANLSGAKATDLSPLIGSAQSLKTLILTNVPTSDVASLLKLHKLESLYLQGTKIPASADRDIENNNPDVEIKRSTSAFVMRWPPGMWDFSAMNRVDDLCGAP